jgi:hypothetical protein
MCKELSIEVAPHFEETLAWQSDEKSSYRLFAKKILNKDFSTPLEMVRITKSPDHMTRTFYYL